MVEPPQGLGFDVCAARVALMVAMPEESYMSSPALDPIVGDEWSQKLLAAEIEIAVGACAKRSCWLLQEIMFLPTLPAEPPPKSPPATSYSTPKPLPVMTLFSTLLPTPPLLKARPVLVLPLSTIRFPVITWLIEASI